VGGAACEYRWGVLLTEPLQQRQGRSREAETAHLRGAVGPLEYGEVGLGLGARLGALHHAYATDGESINGLTTKSGFGMKQHRHHSLETRTLYSNHKQLAKSTRVRSPLSRVRLSGNCANLGRGT